MEKKVASKKGLESKVIHPTIKYPDDLFVRYINYALFTITDRDLSIDVGLRHIHNGNEEVQMVERLILSPQHAKMFCIKMKDMVDHFESNFGEIALEPIKKK
ncbi:MAG: DUF3467 domain-containing protein [Candidatus Marinimicrobia bacterium]|nr:DUF3467 domain-containing protein [Candidatus Neomarinimicrobiota bacterium]